MTHYAVVRGAPGKGADHCPVCGGGRFLLQREGAAARARARGGLELVCVECERTLWLDLRARELVVQWELDGPEWPEGGSHNIR